MEGLTMCRWLAYRGDEIYLRRLIFDPEHSLIDQSLAARFSESTTNGDGFGIGWYGDFPEPGLFKDVRPAWNDPNLEDLTRHVRSGLFLAHVRATTGTEIQRSNCHPFRHERWLCMHNGLIANFDLLKRDLVMAVAPELFSCIQGTTDSEILFFLALSLGLNEDPIGAVERTVGLVEHIAQRHGVANALQMTLCLADGQRVFAIRYATDAVPRTLFYSGDSACWQDLKLGRTPLPERARVIVSEPFGGLSEAWHAVPPSTCLVVDGDSVESRPFEPGL
jgi:glutamine amidotransferase